MRYNQGLSLLETLFVLSIVTVILTISVPDFSFNSKELKLASEEAKNFIQESCNQAFYKGVKHKIVLTNNSLILQIAGGNTFTLVKKYLLKNEITISGQTSNEVYISPKGSITPFSFKIKHKKHSCKLSISLFQRVSLDC